MSHDARIQIGKIKSRGELEECIASLESELARLREESENWREAFRNMSTLAREQSERIARLEAAVREGKAPSCENYGAACQCLVCTNWRAAVLGEKA